jgi:superfamily I DNA/RNA helicase
MEGAWWVTADELDPDQKRLIEIPRDGKYLVLGPPGSGKTNILILRAAYLYRSGLRNILVVTFTRALKEFIEAGAQNRYRLPRSVFATFANWSQAFIQQAGASIATEDEGDSFDRARMRRIRELQVVVGRNQYGNNHYDAILIDEAQDFWQEEIAVLNTLTDRLFAVGDNRQRIYARNEGIDALRLVGCEENRLDFHYRVGRNICRVADKVLRSSDDPLLIEASAYPETATRSTVEVVQCATFAEQCEEAIRRLAVQLRAYPNEGIGVLCPKRVLRDGIWTTIEASQLAQVSLLQSADAGYQEFDPTHPICVLTIHAAKGMEFRAVHILGAEALSVFPREVAFTAITRAKTSLTIYHTAPLPGFLDSALAPPPTALPKLSDLF